MTTNFQQMPLDLRHVEALGREDFLVSQCNAMAVSWIDKWPKWPESVRIIYGSPASGKTHLLSVWAEKSQAHVISAKELVNKGWESFEAEQSLAIDDIHSIIGDREDEKQLFHIYNHLIAESGNLLLISETAPQHLEFQLPDLASRMKAATACRIEEPDDALLTAILVKMFSDRNLTLSPEVLNYILPRIERSFNTARKFVEDADRHALSKRRGITIPLVREVLSPDF